MHHDESVIAADFELSERLGREIEEAGCEPLNSEPRAQVVMHFTEYVLLEGLLQDGPPP